MKRWEVSNYVCFLCLIVCHLHWHLMVCAGMQTIHFTPRRNSMNRVSFWAPPPAGFNCSDVYITTIKPNRTRCYIDHLPISSLPPSSSLNYNPFAVCHELKNMTFQAEFVDLAASAICNAYRITCILQRVKSLKVLQDKITRFCRA